MAKTIVITGAGSGLGRSLALQFNADGETVFLLGRTLAKLEAVAERAGANAFAVPCDISDPDAVRVAFARIAETHPKIDVLINNAALTDFTTLAEASDAHILQTVGTNLLGNLFCSRSAIAMMDRGGHIINVSSESVEERFPYHVVYQATKGAIETMSSHLQTEVKSSGLRVSVVRPGAMLDEERRGQGSSEAIQRYIETCAERGLDVINAPVSAFGSIYWVFRSLVDMPDDMHVTNLRFVPRHP